MLVRITKVINYKIMLFCSIFFIYSKQRRKQKKIFKKRGKNNNSIVLLLDIRELLNVCPNYPLLTIYSVNKEINAIRCVI